MTEHLHDTRVIAPEAEKYNATLVRREDDGPDLARFWVRADDEAARFEPGQYMTIGVYADEMLYQRPYSVASAPADAHRARATSSTCASCPSCASRRSLWRLPVGHQMRMIGPKGRFMLEPDDERTHLFVSTGTGIAPFISMCRQLLHDGTAAAHRHAATAAATRTSWATATCSRAGSGTGTYPVTYVPTISRPQRGPQRGLERLHGSRRGGRRSTSAATTASSPEQHRRVPVRQPRDDHQRRDRAHGPRLPGVPRQEGALLAEGQEASA